MSAARVVARGRLAAERLMIDTCSVSYPTGATVWNEASGRDVPVYAVDFESPCQFQSTALVTEDADVGARREVVDKVTLKLPVTAPQVRTDALVECLTVGLISDPRLVGRKFLVGAPFNKTYATATRLELKEYVE
jgi:hypothetical protein